MSKSNGLNIDDDIEVSDDEEYTDKKIKQRILNARQLLLESEHELFSARLVNPDVNYTELEALQAWGNLVRSYIRDLGVLLNIEDLPQATYFRDSVELGTVELIPPDKDGYPFSQAAYQEVDDKQLLRTDAFADFGRGAELPEPKERTFEGLTSIINAPKVLTARWIVVKNPRAAPPNREQIALETQRPIPKYIYEDALVEADQFLQGAGIGLDISAKDYMAEGEPGL